MTNLCKKVDKNTIEPLFFGLGQGLIEKHHLNNNQRLTIEELEAKIKEYGKGTDRLGILDVHTERLIKSKTKLNQENYVKTKQGLSYVYICGHAPTGNSSSFAYNGLICLDIDCRFKGGDKIAADLKQKLCFLPYVVLIALSPSKYGLRVAIKTNHKTPALYNQIRDKIHLQLRELIKRNFPKKGDSVKLDPITYKAPTYLARDSRPYINANAQAIKIDVIDLQVLTNPSEKAKRKAGSILAPELVQRACKTAYLETISKTGENNHRTIIAATFAGICNTFGIEEEAAADYLTTKQALDKKHLNTITDIYRRHPEQYGTNIFCIMDSYQLPKPHAVLNETETAEDKLSSVLKPNQLKDSCIAVAPTAAGKSYFIGNIMTRRRIMVCPTQALVQEMEEYNAVPFYQGHRDIPNDCDLIATTYKSLPSLMLKINPAEWSLCIDEYHNFVTSATKSFQLNELNALADCLLNFKNYYLFSASPVQCSHPLLDMNKLPIINIERKTYKKKTAKTIYYKDQKEAVRIMADRVINKQGRKLAILFNVADKNNVDLKELISTLSKYKPAIINSKTTDSGDFIKIIKEKNFKDTDLLISTTLIKEGNNIKHIDKDVDVIILGAHHPVLIYQYSTRFRPNKVTNVYIFRPVKQKGLERNFLQESFVSKLEEQTQKAFYTCNQIAGIDTDENLKKSMIQQAAAAAGAYLRIDTTDKLNYRLQPDFLSISNAAYEEEKTIANKDAVYMHLYLKRYGFISEGSEDLTAGASAELKKLRKELREQKKEQDKQIRAAVFENLENEDAETNLQKIDSLERLDKQRTKEEDKELSLRTQIDSLTKYKSFESLVSMLKDADTTQKRNKLNKQLFWDLTKIAGRLSPTIAKTRHVLFLNEILNAHNEGDAISKKQAANTVITALERAQGHKITNVDTKVFNNAIDVFEGIFGTYREQRRIEGKRERMYIIESKAPSGLSAKSNDSEILKTLRSSNDSKAISGESYLLSLAGDIKKFKPIL